MSIRDVVSGQCKYATAYFYFHPDITIDESDGGAWRLESPNGPIALVRVFEGRAHLKQSFHAPGFGERYESQCLCVDLGVKGSSVRISWEKSD